MLLQGLHRVYVAWRKEVSEWTADTGDSLKIVPELDAASSKLCWGRSTVLLLELATPRTGERPRRPSESAPGHNFAARPAAMVAACVVEPAASPRLKLARRLRVLSDEALAWRHPPPGERRHRLPDRMPRRLVDAKVSGPESGAGWLQVVHFA